MEIPLVGDAVDQTLSVHNSMLERGGLFGTAYSLWFSTTCQGLNVAASALKATETTSGATVSYLLGDICKCKVSDMNTMVDS